MMTRGWRDVWVVRLLRLGGGGREGENGLEDGMQEVRGEKGYRTMVGVVGVGAASSTSTAARVRRKKRLKEKMAKVRRRRMTLLRRSWMRDPLPIRFWVATLK